MGLMSKALGSAQSTRSSSLLKRAEELRDRVSGTLSEPAALAAQPSLDGGEKKKLA